MRVDGFTQYGYFWLKDEQDKKFFGAVTVKNGGGATLKIQLGYDNFDSLHSFENKIWQQNGDIAIFGKSKNKYLVCLNCFIQTLDQNDNTVTFRIGRYIFDTDFSYNFSKPKSIKFSFDNIVEWSKEIFSQTENNYNKDERIVTIEKRIREKIQLLSNEEVDIYIWFEWKAKSEYFHHHSINYVKETPCIYIDIKDEKLFDFEFLFEKVYQFIGFILISTGYASSIQNVEIFYKDKYSPIYYRSSPFDNDLKTVSKFDMCLDLYNIKKLSNNNCDIIKNWFDNFDKISNSINLYILFKSTKGVNVENTFLWLVQSLEGLNRRTISDKTLKKSLGINQSDKIFLKHRIEYLFKLLDILNIDLFKKYEKEYKELPKIISNFRNDITHSNENFKMSRDKACDLIAFNFLLELVYLLNLFRLLNLGDKELKIFIQRYYLSYIYRSSLKLINEYFEKIVSVSLVTNQNPY